MKTHQFVFAFGAVLSAFFVSAKTPLVGLPSKGVLSEKSQFNLFNPTPRELWRELSPDRPDVTESPITLDAGAYGLEVSLFDWRRNEAGDEAFTYLSTNFKIGLTNDIDIQFVFDAYSEEEPSTSGGLEGFSDLQIRLKYNLWGNDEEGTAFALFPYVKIPTGTELSNDEWEGGLILPFGTQLTALELPLRAREPMQVTCWCSVAFPDFIASVVCSVG